ncbi:MAG: hypothetical protein KA764_15920 [Anaerolineales bacterium]|nr:hypothetical protein [Anaerolineales bacterium]
MAHPKLQPAAIDTEHYVVLAPVPPFLDVILPSTPITAREFSKIVHLAAGYPNDPRMIEMVRQGGDASAKVPYLMAAGESADSILATLREMARPHVERLQTLPDPLRATIHLLLSINAVPQGCERYGIPALLEIDQMQGAMVAALQERMSGRRLALEFHAANHNALAQLDEAWPRLREARRRQDETSVPKPAGPLPEQARLHYVPFFDKAGRLVSVSERCAIVAAPETAKLQWFTPAVLRRPLPETVPVPAAGSADWLIREVGKIGRHFTRALLEIIRTHLAAERVALEARNYEQIYQHAQEALREYVEDTP